MISEKSIQEVKDQADLVEVIRKSGVSLKQKGASYTGSCPFHDEKSASFTVSPAKGLYKCFGCGATGHDAIRFIMEKENRDFVSTVKYLAGEYNITLEETGKDEETTEQQMKRADFLNINNKVAKLYQRNLFNLKLQQGYYENNEINPVIDELINNRRFTNDSIVKFQIGFAPDEWRFISGILIENALFKPAEELGLVATKNSNNFDTYRNRIIFPIQNERGEIIGFGGRKMEDGKKDNPKYINSRESLIYKKDQVLYGLYQAAKAIREMKFAILVEGYADVISFHQTGMENTVAACGTSLTDGHCKLLRKYTNHIIQMNDSDPAGQKANFKNVDLLLKHGFKVDICELPDNHDPDSFARTLEPMEEAA